MVNGRLEGNPDAKILGAKTDSRICTQGDLFAALPGEHLDGSWFIQDAWKNGASVVMTADESDLFVPGPEQALIRVSTILESLQEAAGEWRKKANKLRVTGITGSNGKTTTKNILAAILVHWRGDEILVTPQSYNSDIGLPLVLLGINAGHTLAVLEMGMNYVGEMALLSRLAVPEIAIITNIGTAHIGMLGSVEGIAREKKSILESASVVIINKEEPWKDFLLADFSGDIRYFGIWGEQGWDGFEDRGAKGFLLRRHGANIEFGLPGRHNLLNAMAAVEAALVLGAPETSIRAGLENVRPAFGRSEILEGRIMVLRDCYNANPESLKAAIELFGSLPCKNRRVVVLGELLELGSQTAASLKKAGKVVEEAEADAVFLFGETLSVLPDLFKESGYSGLVRYYTDIDSLGADLAEYVDVGDCVLLKGSRGSALERLDSVLL